MKNMKKILALLVAVLMLMSSFAALADTTYGATNTHVITIENPDQVVSHTYEGYQIFVGNLNATENKLSDVRWGEGVDGPALINALVSANTTDGALKGKFPNLTASSTAADLAKELDNWPSSNGQYTSANQTDAFAKIIAEHVNASKKISFTEDPAKTYKANVSGDGYYFIKDVTTVLTDSTGHNVDTLSRFLLRVIKDQTITAKDSGTKSDKVIVEGNTESNDNDAAIGDTITYKSTLNPIPDPSKYNRFWLEMTDTMDHGLTFLGINSITIDGNTVETSKYDVYVSYDEGNNWNQANAYSAPTDPVREVPANNAKTTFKIVFKNAKALIQGNAAEGVQPQYAGKELAVNYSAILNKDAVVAPGSNDNTEHFRFSNNPNVDYNGDDITDDNVVGTTPDKTVETYTTAIEILKVDGSNNNAALPGAIFKITALEVFNLTKVTGTKFERDDENGTYWKLKDGSYTNTDPTSVTNTTQYENTQQKYTKVDYTDTVLTPDTEGTGKSYTLVSDANGRIKLTGVKAGTYTVTEVNSPDGYNKIDGTETLTIGWSTVHGTNWISPDVTAKQNANGGFTLTSSDGMEGIQFTLTGDKDANPVVFQSTVQNNQGVELPSTGGMGTTILYIGGSILVILAAILLITKRRMNAQD